jgi:hypothetical protein
VGLVELSGQRLKLRLGVQGRGSMVGDPHATLDRAAQPLGELVADVAELVLLASGEHGMVEHVEHGAAQRLGPVQHAQDRPGWIQAALAQPDQSLAGQGGVLGGALHQGQGVLGPSTPMPNATTQVCSPKCTPSISNATRSNPLRSALMSSARAVWVMATNRRETAEREVPDAACSTPTPTGSSPTR